jgi:hypothetical protein
MEKYWKFQFTGMAETLAVIVLARHADSEGGVGIL